MFLSVGHEKNVIYLKLVNNPFKLTFKQLTSSGQQTVGNQNIRLTWMSALLANMGTWSKKATYSIVHVYLRFTHYISIFADAIFGLDKYCRFFFSNILGGRGIFWLEWWRFLHRCSQHTTTSLVGMAYNSKSCTSKTLFM